MATSQTQSAPVVGVRGSSSGGGSKRGAKNPDAVETPNPQPSEEVKPEAPTVTPPADPPAAPEPMTAETIKKALGQDETPNSNPLDTHPEAQRNPAPFFPPQHKYVIEDPPTLTEKQMNSIPREFAMVAKIGTPAGITLIHSRNDFDALGGKTVLPCVEAKFHRVGADPNIRRFNVMHVPEVDNGKVHWATVALRTMATKYYMGGPRTQAGLIYPWSDYQANRADALVVQQKQQTDRVRREAEIQEKATKRGRDAQMLIRQTLQSAAEK